MNENPPTVEIFYPNFQECWSGSKPGIFGSKGTGFDPLQGFLKVWAKNFYRGRILIHGFPEPLGTKYHGLDTPVLGIQLFTEIHFGGVWTSTYH